jgi:hypothetical protein
MAAAGLSAHRHTSHCCGHTDAGQVTYIAYLNSGCGLTIVAYGESNNFDPIFIIRKNIFFDKGGVDGEFGSGRGRGRSSKWRGGETHISGLRD